MRGDFVALGLEAVPEGLNLGTEHGEITRVVKDIVGLGGLFGIGDLVAEAEAGVGFGGVADGTGGRDAGGVTGDLEVVGRGDDDDAVDAAAPVGEDGFRFAAGAGVADDFEDEGGFDDGNGGGVAREDLVHHAALKVDDGGMDDGVELLEPVAREGELSEARAVEMAVWGEDFRAEGADDFGEDGLAGLHEVAAKGVGFDDLSAVFTEHGGDGGFAAAEAAGEAYA